MIQTKNTMTANHLAKQSNKRIRISSNEPFQIKDKSNNKAIKKKTLIRESMSA